MNINFKDFVGSTDISITAARPSAIRPSALRRVRRVFRRLCTDQRGANFIEYSVLAFFIAIFGMGFVKAFGEDIQKSFQRLGGDVGNIGAKGQTGAATAPAK